MKLLKLIPYITLSFIVFGLQSCGGGSEVSPKSIEDRLVGYWAITHIKTVEHKGGCHNTADMDVPPHGLDIHAGVENPRWDVLIFDEDYVTVRGDMPSCPKGHDYDRSTIDGLLQYENDLQEWYESIGSVTDYNACPVGSYHIKGNDLIIGSLNMGTIRFNSDNEFTLDYTRTRNNSGDYTRLIYIYTRIYSLNM